MENFTYINTVRFGGKMLKPFSSLFVKGSLFVRWKAAIHDPAYIILNAVFILWLLWIVYRTVT